MKLKNSGIIALFVGTMVISGCSTTPVTNQDDTKVTEKTDQQITVDILNYDRSITKVTTTEAELNGVNGCFIYDKKCYVKSSNPDHNGAYVPEGVDFYPAEETDQEVTVDILNYDSSITKVTTTEAELNGVNGCFMYDEKCYIKSSNPDHNGAYVPEGVDFYPAEETDPSNN